MNVPNLPEIVDLNYSSIGNVAKKALRILVVGGGLAVALARCGGDTEVTSIDDAINKEPPKSVAGVQAGDDLTTEETAAIVSATSTDGTLSNEEPVAVDGVSVEPAPRYSDGVVHRLNKLKVDWYGNNEECKEINPKYGNTTGDLLVDNIMDVLKEFGLYNTPRVDFADHGVFEKGFEADHTFESKNKDELEIHARNSFFYWQDKSPFVIISSLNEATLTRLGNEIKANACNDPEQQTSSHIDSRLDDKLFTQRTDGLFVPSYDDFKHGYLNGDNKVIQLSVPTHVAQQMHSAAVSNLMRPGT